MAGELLTRSPRPPPFPPNPGSLTERLSELFRSSVVEILLESRIHGRGSRPYLSRDARRHRCIARKTCVRHFSSPGVIEILPGAPSGLHAPCPGSKLFRNTFPLYEEAVSKLGKRKVTQADAGYVDTQNRQIITYRCRQYDLTEQGWLDWTHARQLVRSRRVVEELDTEATSVGNRYYITSKPPRELGARSALKVSRARRRCENCTHWTADVERQEGRRRLAWSRHPDGIPAVAILRMTALAILSIARQLTRMGYSRERPSWSQVAEHFLLQLCESLLETEAFDGV